jgi:hypothetical protein
MSWKSTARSIPAAHMRAQREKAAKENPVGGDYIPGEGKWRQPTPFVRPKRMELRNGKPFVLETHTRDLHQVDEETGKKYIAASTRLMRGQYVFPAWYLHTKMRFVGKVVDVRFREGRGWEIYLDGILRDKSGKPVPHPRYPSLDIDCSGWYPESDLRDAGFGLKPIKPGKMRSESAIIEARNERIKRANR